VDEKVRQLMAQINVLEDELRAVLHRAEVPLFYHLDGKRIKFDHTVREAHRRSKTGLLRWLVKSRPPTVAVAPVIYGLILPLLLLDLGLTVYQAICFPVYRINKVNRSDYIVMDRWHLSYLNFMEKFNCAYCAYANGLLAYGTEIAARTEQYWSHQACSENTGRPSAGSRVSCLRRWRKLPAALVRVPQRAGRGYRHTGCPERSSSTMSFAGLHEQDV